ncbi:MAG: DAK2 domain-containing protein [Treponema sp.]|nr:DAK2 domain-containing protein [Treponema sp.]
MNTKFLTGDMLLEMVRSGAECLQLHCDEVNDLNVFPIPDGDTGSNMFMTIQGGANTECSVEKISDTAQSIAHNMLLSARGNSGVILSQLFAGIADGLKGLESAGISDLENACKMGVERAYNSVLTPTEGTILTVAKETSNAVCNENFDCIEEVFEFSLDEAKKALEKTPEQLEVLKQAGVVDSGGAGLVYIIEGMQNFLIGKKSSGRSVVSAPAPADSLNVDLFTADSELGFGYCTELLVRLQNRKCNPDEFDINTLIEYLNGLGDSIVAFKDGTIVKLHVHTKTPQKVLDYCQQYGEFLKVKIENMQLQHNEVVANEQAKETERKQYAIIAVANGEGIKQELTDFGADIIIDGGQTMNPSASELIAAFDKANAQTIFVLPNNGNIILAAKQAAELYKKSDVRVIPTKNIGDCYSVLSMMDLEAGDADAIEQNMNESMVGTLTAEISKSIRSTQMDGIDVREGEYIGILGKKIVSSDTDCYDTALAALKLMEPNDHSSLIILRGKTGDEAVAADIASFVRQNYPRLEVYESFGGQNVYDFILVVN